jgi:hypothetical protein
LGPERDKTVLMVGAFSRSNGTDSLMVIWVAKRFRR